MNNSIQCPLCDNNVAVGKVKGKAKVTCPVCNASFECKLFSDDSVKAPPSSNPMNPKTYKPLSIVFVLLFVCACFFFYKKYNGAMRNEQTVKDIHNLMTKVHLERSFKEIEVRRSIADSLNIPYYIADTDKTPDEVTALVNKEIEALLEQE